MDSDSHGVFNECLTLFLPGWLTPPVIVLFKSPQTAL